MKIPTPLDHSLALAVVSPSSPPEPAKVQAGVNRLREAGLRLLTPLATTWPVGYLAAGDDARLQEFQQRLADDAVGGVICARGGYGLLRLLTRINTSRWPARPKWLVGFSDVTALHALAYGAGLISLHAPLITTIPAEPQPVIDEMIKSLTLPDVFMRETIYEGQGLVPGRAAGRLWGGNLTLLTSLLGTPFFPDPAGMILLIEETREAPYRIDRMITQLMLAGVTEKVAGIGVGHLTQCESPTTPRPSALEVIRERLGRLSCPTLLGLPFGHQAPNRPILLGARATLDAIRGQLYYEPE